MFDYHSIPQRSNITPPAARGSDSSNVKPQADLPGQVTAPHQGLGSSPAHAQLNSLHRLQEVWSKLLQGARSQLPKPNYNQSSNSKDKPGLNNKENSRTRASGSDNTSFSKLNFRLFSDPVPTGKNPPSNRQTEAQTTTHNFKNPSTTQNQATPNVQIHSHSDSRLSSGRRVTSQLPVNSPILDQIQGQQLLNSKQPQREPLPRISTHKLAEFALAHAGHSIESLLKKAYRLESRSQLNSQESMLFFTLVLKLSGEFTASHSARVLDLAMDLADEIGLDDETRRQVEGGIAYKDLGEMALLLDKQPDEKTNQIAQWMSGQDLHQAGLLHDIGKTRIPTEILYKPGKLSEEEYEIMKLHPILGEQIIWPIESLRHLCPIIRGHHERWDGQGYPDGLQGEHIPLGARIITVADVFDALHAERPYKAALPVEKVRAILLEGRGTHFDPALADAFGRVLERRYPELGNPFL